MLLPPNEPSKERAQPKRAHDTAPSATAHVVARPHSPMQSSQSNPIKFDLVQPIYRLAKQQSKPLLPKNHKQPVKRIRLSAAVASSRAWKK